MVNNKRLQILNKLKNSDQWLSGEQISREIGISRVAVWKQIQALINQGYPVSSGHKGYRIIEDNDTLSELEFGEDRDILFYRELSSTMDEALRQLCLKVENSGSFMVLADQQSGGINRDEGVWDSPSGGIYLTFVLNESMPAGNVPLMKKRGILAVLETLKAFGIEGPGFSTRGEIFLGSKKCAGILEEYLVRGDRVQWYTLGIGLHINDTPGDTASMTSVALHSGVTLDRALVVKQLKKCWEDVLTGPPDRIEEGLDSYKRVS